MIAFAGPNPRGWCVDGARAIRTATALERAAKHYAEEPMPTLIFKNTSGVDLPDEKVTRDSRPMEAIDGAQRTTGYVNAALDIDHIGFSAVDMQLTEGRQQAVLEIARLTGVPHGLLAAIAARRDAHVSQYRGRESTSLASNGAVSRGDRATALGR